MNKHTICLLLLFIILVTIILVPVEVDAATASPDTLVITQVDCYQGLLQDTDQLYIIQYNLAYSGTPPADYTAHDLFLVRLMNATDSQLSAVRLSDYFNDGYASGLVGMYFSAGQVESLGLLFGPGSGYYMQLVGDPMIAWEAGTPPYSNEVTFANYYMEDIQSTLYTRLSNQFTTIERDWDEDLIEGPSGEKKLTATGEDYATDAIDNLGTLCPDIFSARTKKVQSDDFDATVISDFYIGGDNATYGCYGNVWLAQTFTASTDYEIDTISVKANYFTTAHDTQVRLYNFTGDPGTTLLASGTIPAAELLEQPAYDWEHVAVTPYELEGGTTYTIVMVCNGGTITQYTNWRYDTTGNYEGGSVYTSVDGGATWTNQAAFDFQFQTSALGAYDLSYLNRMQHALDDTVFDPDLTEELGLSSMWIRSLIWMAIAIVVSVTVAYHSQNSKPITPVFFWFTSAGYFVGMINPYIALGFALLGGLFAIWMGIGRLSSA